jgi:hypothetical protein
MTAAACQGPADSHLAPFLSNRDSQAEDARIYNIRQRDSSLSKPLSNSRAQAWHLTHAAYVPKSTVHLTRRPFCNTPPACAQLLRLYSSTTTSLHCKTQNRSGTPHHDSSRSSNHPNTLVAASRLRIHTKLPCNTQKAGSSYYQQHSIAPEPALCPENSAYLACRRTCFCCAQLISWLELACAQSISLAVQSTAKNQARQHQCVLLQAVC